MTTQFISMQDYRENIGQLRKQAQKENIRYIVMVHSKPIFEVIPLPQNTKGEHLLSWTPSRQEAYQEAMSDYEQWKNIVALKTVASKYKKWHTKSSSTKK